MHVPEPYPRQALHEVRPERIVCDGYVHITVDVVVLVGPEEHHFIVLREVVVGDTDAGGAADDVDEAVCRAREVAVVDPDVLRGED